MNKSIKRKNGLFLSLGSILIGIIMRLNSKEMVWPDNYSYSGARENTSWGIKEAAINEISILIICFGLIVLLIIFSNWLWDSDNS